MSSQGRSLNSFCSSSSDSRAATLLGGADDWTPATDMVIDGNLSSAFVYFVLEAALADIYGPQNLLHEGVLPASLVLALRMTPLRSAAPSQPISLHSLLAGARFVGRNPILLGAVSLDLMAVLLALHLLLSQLLFLVPALALLEQFVIWLVITPYPEQSLLRHLH